MRTRTADTIPMNSVLMANAWAALLPLAGAIRQGYDGAGGGKVTWTGRFG
jgi:hypothetical protein